MTAQYKGFIRMIRSSCEEYKEELITLTIQAQVYFSGAVFLVYSAYTAIMIAAEYAAWQSWTPQNLYGFLISAIAAASWFVFRKQLVPRERTIFVSDCFLFLLLMLLGIARGLGSIYVSYGLAVCTAVASVVLSLNPLRYSLFALLAALGECVLYLMFAGFDLQIAIFGVVLYNTIDAALLLIVSASLNLFVSILRYQVLNETSVLKMESSTDALTGLYNRKYFEHYFRFHHRDDELSALIHMDLDNFKTLNDTLGHQQGDATLVRVAEILRGNFRKTDCVARMGGDEFMVFMPSLSETRHAEERIRKLLEQFPVVVREQDTEVPVSISIGVAFSKKHRASSYQELYDLADEAMYQAKKAGKRRAVIADGNLENGIRFVE